MSSIDARTVEDITAARVKGNTWGSDFNFLDKWHRLKKDQRKVFFDK